MKGRQSSIPRQWLIVDSRVVGRLGDAAKRLRPGDGVLVLAHDLPAGRRERLIRWLRYRSASRSIVLVDEATNGMRVHDLHELRKSLLARTPLIMLSPIHRTRSHPEWQPVRRMRAAAYARLAGRRLIGLGGMDEQRFRRIQRLGFIGWAGIDAWLRT